MVTNIKMFTFKITHTHIYMYIYLFKYCENKYQNPIAVELGYSHGSLGERTVYQK